MAKRGNPNPKGGKPDKLMRDALMLALNREAKDSAGKKTKKLTMIADALVDKGIAGDVAAIKEIADRVDGKAPQAIVGPAGGPVQVETSARPPLTRDEWLKLYSS